MERVQASREERIRAVTSQIATRSFSERQLAPGGRLPFDIVRTLAELAVDAVSSADDREIHRIESIRGKTT